MSEKRRVPVQDAIQRAQMRRHAESLMQDPGFLAEVAETEAAMKRYHETGEDPFPDARPAAEVLAPYRTLADEAQGSEMRDHAEEMKHDAGFLAEVVASEAEAAKKRYHETEDPAPDLSVGSLPIPAPPATLEFVAGGMRRRSARAMLETTRFKYGAVEWNEEKHGLGLIGESLFVVRGSQESIRYLMDRLRTLLPDGQEGA